MWLESDPRRATYQCVNEQTPKTSPRFVVCPKCSAVNRVAPERPAAEAVCGACKARLFTGEPISLTAATFDRHLDVERQQVVVG